MSSERPTVRPVTLARLVEVAHVCESNPHDDEAIEAARRKLDGAETKLETEVATYV